MKDRILESSRELASMAVDEEEYAVVIYEDGAWVLFSGASMEVQIPLIGPHGRAVAVIHTHPVPRTAPSLPDLAVLISMTRLGVIPAYLATVYASNGKATVTLYTATRPLPHGVEKIIAAQALKYEKLNYVNAFSPSISEKQLREQHALLSKLGISVERYQVAAQ